VTAITVLNSEKNTPFMLNVAEDFLNKFVKEFETLYGLNFCSINVHQLLHLPDCVRKLGPLWTFSCFEYENINGQLLKLIHGTSHIDTQIARSHDRRIKMIRLIEHLPENSIRDFCLSRKKQVKIIEKISENCFTVGTYQNIQPIPNYLIYELHNLRIFQNAVVYKYFRLLKNGKLFVSKMYERDLKSHSYIVQYINDNQLQLGSISYFIKITSCNCIRKSCRCNGNHYAVIPKIITDNILFIQGNNFIYDSNTFLHKCHITNNIVLIPVNNIIYHSTPIICISFV